MSRPTLLAGWKSRTEIPVSAKAAVAACLMALLSAPVPVPAEVSTPGSVMGVLRLEGPAPKRSPLPVFKHREICGEGVPDERLVIGPGGGVRYAVVSIDGVRGGLEPARDLTHVLDNRVCRFEPHVQVAEVGQWLELHNSDPLLHNADARLGDRTLFNVALWPERRVRKPLAQAGLVKITCDVRHTWMTAYVAVAEHPYHAVTDVYGEYEIREIPPGSYTLRVWHEELGTIARPLDIEPGRMTIVDLTYPAAKAPGEARR
jgi:hypothetical protein